MIAGLIAIIIFGLTTMIWRAVHGLPLHELKRRGRQGHDPVLYRLAVRGRKVDWLLISLDIIVLVYALNRLDGWVAQLVLLAILAWLTFGWRPPQDGVSSRLVLKVAAGLDSLLNHVPGMHAEAAHPPVHTKVFEKEDLLELFERQAKQTDSRVNEAELATAVRALRFSELKVRDAMTPIDKAKLVSETDAIGPHLLSELHSAGDSFLVVKSGPKSSQPAPVGTLYLDDALKHSEGGLVKEAMHPGVEYIDEDLALITALDEFLKQKRHFFAVTNNFEELVGTLSLRGLMEQIFGPKHVPKADEPEPQEADDDKIAEDENEDVNEPGA